MKPEWCSIDTVLLDMDGTLLDLHFDNFFWRRHLPMRYAEHHELDEDIATKNLYEKFADKAGTLDWYCLEYWSAELGLDIVSLKHEVRELIRERPQTLEFLQALGVMGKHRILVTNAHPDSLHLKLSVTQIESHLDRVISSHSYSRAKEDQEFWTALQAELRFDTARTLFIDDSEAVLDAARAYGLRHLYCIEHPDSRGEPRRDLPYPAIQAFSQLVDMEFD